MASFQYGFGRQRPPPPTGFPAGPPVNPYGRSFVSSGAYPQPATISGYVRSTSLPTAPALRGPIPRQTFAPPLAHAKSIIPAPATPWSRTSKLLPPKPAGPTRYSLDAMPGVDAYPMPTGSPPPETLDPDGTLASDVAQGRFEINEPPSLPGGGFTAIPYEQAWRMGRSDLVPLDFQGRPMVKVNGQWQHQDGTPVTNMKELFGGLARYVNPREVLGYEQAQQALKQGWGGPGHPGWRPVTQGTVANWVQNAQGEWIDPATGLPATAEALFGRGANYAYRPPPEATALIQEKLPPPAGTEQTLPPAAGNYYGVPVPQEIEPYPWERDIDPKLSAAFGNAPNLTEEQWAQVPTIYRTWLGDRTEGLRQFNALFGGGVTNDKIEALRRYFGTKELDPRELWGIRVGLARHRAEQPPAGTEQTLPPPADTDPYTLSLDEALRANGVMV